MRPCLVVMAMSLAACSAQTSAVPSPAPSVPGAPPTTTVPAPPLPGTTTPPPSVLSPGSTPEAERRLSATAQNRIDGAEQLVKGMDGKQLATDQRESYSTIQSFIAKAREAMTAKDFQRAYTLADKAYQLAEELARRVR